MVAFYAAGKEKRLLTCDLPPGIWLLIRATSSLHISSPFEMSERDRQVHLRFPPGTITSYSRRIDSTGSASAAWTDRKLTVTIASNTVKRVTCAKTCQLMSTL